MLISTSAVCISPIFCHCKLESSGRTQKACQLRTRSKGKGFDTGLRIGYLLGQRIQPFISARYTQIEAGKGTDKLYMANGDIYKSRLNEVNSSSISFGIGVKILF